MNEHQRKIREIAEQDGVTPEEVKPGINEAEGLLSMIAADSEVAPDSIPRITTCPICGGGVGFAPLCMDSRIPRLTFTPETTWRECRQEWQEYVIACYEQGAKEKGVALSQEQRLYVELTAVPYALILECSECGKGFDAR